MDQLTIIERAGNDISAWDFERIKAELKKRLDTMYVIQYTDESIKNAKADRTDLKKGKNAVMSLAKEYKARCLAPYEAVEPKIKELVALIDEYWMSVDGVVKDYEGRQQEEKKAEIRRYYDRKAIPLGRLADVLYDKLFDPKWANASTLKSKYEEGILSAVGRTVGELDEIRSWHSPFEEEIVNAYVQNLSVEKARQKDQELRAAAAKVVTAVSPMIPAAPQTYAPAEEPDTVKKDIPSDERVLVIRIPRNQPAKYELVCDFLNAVGVSYEE